MFRSLLRSTLLATGLSLATFAASAQTVQDIVTKPNMPITFLGLDFSNVKYFGDPGTVVPSEMKGLFTKMNELMVKESDKYAVGKAVHHYIVNYNISVAEAVNEKIDPTTLLSTDNSQRNRFTTEKIEGFVKNYTFPASATGLGVVFVMEELVKPEELTVFWVTFVDMTSKKMIFTQKVGGTAMGFGFRNHWAGGIYDGIKNIKSIYYANWKKKFAKG